MIFLLARKWRGVINIASMRYFKDIRTLEDTVREHPPEYWSAGEPWHAYRIPEDGFDDGEAKHLSVSECRDIGLRPPFFKQADS